MNSFRPGTTTLGFVGLGNMGSRIASQLLWGAVQTISTERREPTVTTVVAMAKPEAGGPDALLEWFYPGDTSGHEFVYSNSKEQQLMH